MCDSLKQGCFWEDVEGLSHLFPVLSLTLTHKEHMPVIRKGAHWLITLFDYSTWMKVRTNMLLNHCLHCEWLPKPQRKGETLAVTCLLLGETALFLTCSLPSAPAFYLHLRKMTGIQRLCKSLIKRRGCLLLWLLAQRLRPCGQLARDDPAAQSASP